MKCAFFDTCHYQRQLREKPDVWIVAHQLLFQSQASIGEVAGVFIDESFWQAGVWGVSPPARALTLDEIAAPLPLGKARMDEALADVEAYRAKLARALRRQPGTRRRRARAPRRRRI